MEFLPLVARNPLRSLRDAVESGRLEQLAVVSATRRNPGGTIFGFVVRP
jgi:hypothetical protein